MYPLNPFMGTVSRLPAAAAGNQSMMDFLIGLTPMFMIFAIFYFVWFLPMNKKQKIHQERLRNLKKGDKVITNGGLYAEVAKVENPHMIVVKLADNVKVRIQRQAIAGFEGEPTEKAGITRER